MDKEKIIIHAIGYCITFILITCVGLLVLDGFDDGFSNLRYCNELGYDAYAYECNDFLCFDKEYYCAPETLMQTQRQNIPDPLDDGCWFFCGLEKLKQ